MEQKIDEIHKSIVGNGRPGLSREVSELIIIQKSHASTLKIHSGVIDGLNKKLAYYSGAIAVIVFFVTLAARNISLT
jgi:hypothetical protein